MNRRYTTPPHIDERKLRAQAARRRAALVAAGCSTYTIGYRGGFESIVCLCCGLGSSNPHDVRERYCGFCKATHSEWVEQP